MEQSMENIISLIKDIPFFDEFQDGQVKELSAYMSLQQIKQGTVLFHEGDVGDYLFFIIEGVVEIVLENRQKGNKVIASVTAGSSVGEMSMIDDYERSAMVQAATDLEILVFTKTRFEKVLKEKPHLGVLVLRGLARNISLRLRSSQGRYRDLV